MIERQINFIEERFIQKIMKKETAQRTALSLSFFIRRVMMPFYYI